MNKKGFIKELSQETGYDETKCILLDKVIEKHFIVGRKNKEKIINDLQVEANVSKEEAENIYNISMKILTKEMKNKLKHPFK